MKFNQIPIINLRMEILTSPESLNLSFNLSIVPGYFSLKFMHPFSFIIV